MADDANHPPAAAPPNPALLPPPPALPIRAWSDDLASNQDNINANFWMGNDPLFLLLEYCLLLHSNQYTLSEMNALYAYAQGEMWRSFDFLSCNKFIDLFFLVFSAFLIFVFFCF